MKYLVAYTLVSFIAIGVLGFSGLTNHESLFSQCVAATIPGGVPCTEAPHSFQMNLLHANIFQSFTFAISVAALLLAFFMMAIAIDLSSKKLYAQAFRVDSIYESQSWCKFVHWLSLFQQHPGHA